MYRRENGNNSELVVVVSVCVCHTKPYMHLYIDLCTYICIFYIENLRWIRIQFNTQNLRERKRLTSRFPSLWDLLYTCPSKLVSGAVTWIDPIQLPLLWQLKLLPKLSPWMSEPFVWWVQRTSIDPSLVHHNFHRRRSISTFLLNYRGFHVWVKWYQPTWEWHVAKFENMSLF